MSNFLNALKMSERTETENGDLAYVTTGSALGNFVAKIGSLRAHSEQYIIDLFLEAVQENFVIALQLLFYVRDIPNRGGSGLGERRIFYVIFMYLIKNHPSIALKLGAYVPDYGSWRDVRELAKMCFHAGEIEFAKAFLILQVYHVFTQKDAVLAAKWSVDENDRDVAFRNFALNYICETMHITRKLYRQVVVNARKGVLERLMSEKRWDEVNYSAVPSRAAKLYRKAFMKHDAVRYGAFVEKAVKGEVKINAGALNPVELYTLAKQSPDKTLEAQWRQLPNYVGDANALVMADVSGSMFGTPLDVCISLAIYFAERCRGEFKNHFMTFSSEPALVQLQGSTLNKKARNLSSAKWGMSTNIDAAFRLMLRSALEMKVSASDMPKVLLIITDGQFNAGSRDTTGFERIEQAYRQAGYEMPHIVFWNVRASNAFPAQASRFVTLVSGYSASILTSVFKRIENGGSIVDVILASGRYDQIAEAVS